MLKSQKKLYFLSAREFGILLASTTSISSSTTNSRRLIRERLKSYLLSNHCQNLRTQSCFNQRQDFGSHLIVFSSFTNTSNIPNIKFLPTKTFVIDHLLWHRYHHCLKMKNLILVACSLYKYI